MFSKNTIIKRHGSSIAYVQNLNIRILQPAK